MSKALLIGLLGLSLPLYAIDVRPITPKAPLSVDEKATIQLFKKATQSVVYITTLIEVQDYYTFDITQIPRGTGSGMVWDEAGHIVTNFHVVQEVLSGRAEAQVTLSDRSKWPAEVVGIAPDKDLAVLKIKAPRSKLIPLAIGTSGDLQVGQRAYAIGNPFGLDQTLTTGVVSALGREIQAVTGRTIQDVIQTDASINPGNSGGPLLDSGGRLIGVNTMIFSPSGASAGIGFAVPVDTVYRIVPELIQHGRVVRPVLGISILPDNYSRSLKIEGIIILDVASDGPAARAGLKATRRNRRTGEPVLGDVITGVNGKKVRVSNDLYNILENYKPGDRVTLEILRGSSKLSVPLTLETARE